MAITFWLVRITLVLWMVETFTYPSSAKMSNSLPTLYTRREFRILEIALFPFLRCNHRIQGVMTRLQYLQLLVIHMFLVLKRRERDTTSSSVSHKYMRACMLRL